MKEDGIDVKYIAKFVSDLSSLKCGIHYQASCISVLKIESFKTVLVVTEMKGYKTGFSGTKIAFLNS